MKKQPVSIIAMIQSLKAKRQSVEHNNQTETKSKQKKKDQLLQKNQKNVKEQGYSKNRKAIKHENIQKQQSLKKKELNENNSDLSASEQKQEDRNVKFYRNQIKSVPRGDFIDLIHKKWWGNYDLLQDHHGYIQWLFPNLFQSRFNSFSAPLGLKQIKQFKNDPQLAKRYLKSYGMMLQFYGMKLKNKVSGEITRSRFPHYKARYEKTLLSRFHNHMRITRILSSLTLVGLGRYAKQLCLFLEDQIHSEDGEMKQLRRYGTFNRQWKQFKEYVEKQEDLNVLLRKK